MGDGIDVSREDQRKLIDKLGTFRLWRSPYGTVRAKKMEDDFHIVHDTGDLRGNAGDYLVVDPDMGRAWVEAAGQFERLHEPADRTP